MANSYWDARRAAEAVRDEPLWNAYSGSLQDMGQSEAYLKGLWDDRNWLNVPGPFYGAETDTCCAGIEQAPGHVLVDERGAEFIWRQPRNEDDLRSVLSAAFQDPFDGYAWDGDDHWTPDQVLQWWEDRGRVEEWLEHELKMTSRTQLDELRRPILLAFLAYLCSALKQDLHSYASWLDRRERAL
jgi:hypothetical protein